MAPYQSMVEGRKLEKGWHTSQVCAAPHLAWPHSHCLALVILAVILSLPLPSLSPCPPSRSLGHPSGLLLALASPPSSTGPGLLCL